MEEHPFDQLTEQAAEGLKADPELCLDVRAELRGHLEDAAGYYAARDGLDPDASAAEARRAFGSPLDVAGALLDANRRRLRLRALVRLAINALLLPLAILAAVWFTYGRIAHAHSMDLSLLTGGASPLPALPALPSTDRQQWQQALAAIQRDFPTNDAQAARAAWERHRNDPDARMFYLFYTQQLMKRTPETYVAALRAGQHLDPDNAYYNYQLAEYYLQQGILAKESQVVRDGSQAIDIVLDQRAIDRGIVEFLAGVKKPHYHEYAQVRMTRELALLPEPRLMEDYLQQVATVSGILFPVYAKSRAMARALCGCQRILLSQRRHTEAEALLHAWKPFARQTIRDADTLIALLVYHACSSTLAHNAVKVYNAAGDHTRARQIEAEFRQCEAIIKVRKQHQPAELRYLAEHGGNLMRTFYPLFGWYPPHAELAPTRALDYVLCEEAAVMLLQLLLLFGLLTALAQSAVWYATTRRGQSAPLLLLPGWEALARITGLGLLLPLGVYALLTRLPVISFRDYSFSYLWPLFTAEMGVLLLVLWNVPLAMTGRLVRRRCETLGVPVPPVKQERRERTGLTVVVTGWAGLCAAVVIAQYQLDVDPFITLGLMLLITAGFILALRLLWRTRREYALYHGTLARSLAPVYALAILFLAILVQPVLQRQEASLLRQDRLFFNLRDGQLPETRIVAHYRQQLLAILDRR